MPPFSIQKRGISSSGRAADLHFFFQGRCDGVVNVTDSKSVPFGGAGSNPANVFCVSIENSLEFAGELSSILRRGRLLLPR